MRRFFAFSAVLALVSCGSMPMVTGPFFEMPMPRSLQLAKTSVDFAYPIVLTFGQSEIKSINEMTNQMVFVAIRWLKGDYKEGNIEKLRTGTLPPFSHSVVQGMESIKGVKVWAEQTEQRDSNDVQILRIIHRVAIPLDGGVLEVLTSLQPGIPVRLNDVLESVRELTIKDKLFFAKP